MHKFVGTCLKASFENAEMKEFLAFKEVYFPLGHMYHYLGLTYLQTGLKRKNMLKTCYLNYRPTHSMEIARICSDVFLLKIP